MRGARNAKDHVPVGEQRNPRRNRVRPERGVSGVVGTTLQDGRRVTVTAGDGMQVVLRVTGDTVFEGIGDRTEIRTGMKVAALYEVPEGIQPTLGYDTLELTVSR